MEASEGRETERMAESAVQSAAETLTYFLRQKDFYLSHVDVSVMSLRNKLKALLKDVDGMRGYNESVQLIEVANNTKNVIDSFIFKIAQQRGETSAGWMSYQSTFNSGIKDKAAIEDLGKKISDLKRRLDEIILSNRSQYGIHNIQPSGEASTSSNQSQIQREKRAPIVEEAEVVSFEEETRTLVGRLIVGDMRGVVVSITGMGGTGKSTLAKKVYDNVHVRKSFDFRCWVNVHQEYLVRDILLACIITFFPWLSLGSMERMSEEDLRGKLSGYLERKRYLVVIDGIWSREAWDGLGTAFPDWENGSRVLLTTRNEEVAKYADTHSTPHKIRFPNYLKPCFLYFGAFRENSEISVRKLIRIWIAEGFVQRRGEKEMEDVAEDYVEELIRRSMIQVSERKSNGMVKKCRINNHLRDLAISKAENEKFMYVYGNKAPTSSIMADRLAITSGDISNCISLNSSTPHLLSLLHFSYESNLPEKLAFKIQVGAFKFLRVMNLQSEEVNYLPDEIGDLIHLRYLRLEMPELEYLPSTITHLSNLQTLDIRYSVMLYWLLDDITKMEQIRHLMLPYCMFSNGMQLHHLSNLQTLSRVEAGSWIEEYGLGKLTNLRDLEIGKIRGDVHMALSRSISKLVHLRSLWLMTDSGSWIPTFESFSKHEHLYKMILIGRLEKLPDPHVFPPNLTELFLERSKLERDPMVTLEKLSNIRSLSIYGDLFDKDGYMGKEMVCSTRGFLLLDTLSIGGFRELEEWRVEEGAMPNLRCLEIESCQRLKMLPDGLRYVTTLQELELSGMSEEFKERVRENEGQDWFKIQHIPSRIIT